MVVVVVVLSLCCCGVVVVGWRGAVVGSGRGERGGASSVPPVDVHVITQRNVPAVPLR